MELRAGRAERWDAARAARKELADEFERVMADAELLMAAAFASADELRKVEARSLSLRIEKVRAGTEAELMRMGASHDAQRQQAEQAASDLRPEGLGY